MADQKKDRNPCRIILKLPSDRELFDEHRGLFDEQKPHL